MARALLRRAPCVEERPGTVRKARSASKLSLYRSSAIGAFGDLHIQSIPNTNNYSMLNDIVIKVKSFLGPRPVRAALISVSLANYTRHQLTLRDHGYGASVSRGVPVYSLAFAGTHCAYPRRDGQAELTWVAGYIPRWFTRPQTVTHPSINRARRRVTSLITTNVLTTTPRRHQLNDVNM